MGFPLFGSGKKIGGVEYLEENFLSWAHKIFPPKSRGKAMRENCRHCSFIIMPSHQPAFMPFTYTPDDFCPHKILIAFLIFSSLPLALVE